MGPSTIDGAQHARAVLVELQRLVAELPGLPVNNDPFCGDSIVEVAGMQATSTHAALLQLVARAWQVAHLTDLGDGHASQHHDEGGHPFTRVTFENVRLTPTEVEWTPEVWREVSERLGQYPCLDQETVEAALALEQTRATRRLEERLGVLVTATQVLVLEPAVSLTRPEEAKQDRPARR